MNVLFVKGYYHYDSFSLPLVVIYCLLSQNSFVINTFLLLLHQFSNIIIGFWALIKLHLSPRLRGVCELFLTQYFWLMSYLIYNIRTSQNPSILTNSPK